MSKNSITIKLNSHKPPAFIEDKRSDWIKFGEDNAYPDYLVSLFNKSATNNAIITGKVNYICGGGVDINSKGLGFEDKAAIEDKTNNVNESEDINAFVKKIVTDGELHNNVAVEVIWSQDGESKELYHIDAGKVRVSADGDRYAYSPDWEKYNKGNSKDIEAGWKEWEAYNPDNPTGSQLFYWSDYRPNMEYYGLPEYIGAVTGGWIEMDFEIGNYHYNNVKNGFVGGSIINFGNGMPPDDQVDAIERSFKRKFTGTDNAGAVMLNFTEEGASPATVTPLQPNNLDKQFEQLLAQVQESIFIGHKVTSPMLFGIRTSGQLGGRTEMVEAFELFNNTYVKPRQDIYERIVNYLLETGDRIELRSVEPITEQLSEQALLQILTTDELRAKAGFEKLSEEVNKVAEALGTISPLVATKVLDNMTAQEIRDIVGLETPDSGVVRRSTTTTAEFSKEDDERILEELAKVGKDADAVQFIASRPLEYDDESGEPIFNEQQFALDIELTDLDRQILDILKDSPTSSAQELADATGADLDAVGESINKLARNGALKVTEGEVAGENIVERTPTADALDELETEPVESDFQIVYRYQTRADVPSAANGSRDFCRRLLALNRVYTREEIDQISALVNRNVWLRRGGFYHNPTTDVTTPYCRHFWRQELIRLS